MSADTQYAGIGLMGAAAALYVAIIRFKLPREIAVLAILLTALGLLLVLSPPAGSLQNFQNLGKRVGFYGIITLGAGLLIISGGIDLSIGSVVGLCAVVFALLLEHRVPPALAISIVLSGGVLIGLMHGLLVTKLRLQPFVVTLCGLFIYRGLALLATSINYKNLWEYLSSGELVGTIVSSSRDVGIGGRPDLADLVFLARGTIGYVPIVFLLLLGVALLAGVLLHASVYGRYLYAVGYNEQAARYAGIATDRYKILAYVLCSSLAALGGILLMLEGGTAQPSNAGTWYELYAITGAVLGGCSLRGGQGSVVGMILGTMILPLLRNLCIFAGIPSELEFTVIGAALLIGTIVDELLKRRSAAH